MAMNNSTGIGTRDLRSTVHPLTHYLVNAIRTGRKNFD